MNIDEPSIGWRSFNSIAEDTKNELVIISGRDRETISCWLSSTNASLIAEHGAWIKEEGKNWQVTQPLRNDWKNTIKPILELYADRTPGSSVEEKNLPHAMEWKKE